ncbi:MAG: GntR family transcriptional regulator [Arthrobacter sp.]
MTAANIGPQARFGAKARLRALQAEIMDLILARELEPGDSLPTENELCAALGVGRNTLRESLKVLQALGVIEIRHGFGMFVAPLNFDALTDGLAFRCRLSLRHRGEEALQLVAVRQSLEVGLIGGAMDLMTPEHLAAVRECLHRIESLADAGAHFVEAGAEFHRRLFEPLNNELLLGLMGVFWKIYRGIQIELGGVRGAGAAGGPQDGLDAADAAELAALAAAHRAIYEAVSTGQKALAAELLAGHFDGIRRRITEAMAE